MGAVKRCFVYVTNLGKMLGPKEGAYNLLWATTTSKEKVANGAFYEPVRKLGGLDARAKDEGMVGELWEGRTECLTSTTADRLCRA
jgi:hypothetical protein